MGQGAFLAPHYILCIAVHAAQQKVYSKIGHYHCQEGRKGISVVSNVITEKGNGTAMQRRGVYEHGDECPYFLGIPAPIPSPGDVCPNCSDEDSSGKQENGGIKHEVAHYIKVFCFIRIPFPAQTCDECGHGTAHGKGKKAICQHDCRHVNTEKRRVENGNKGGNLRRLLPHP